MWAWFPQGQWRSASRNSKVLWSHVKSHVSPSHVPLVSRLTVSRPARLASHVTTHHEPPINCKPCKKPRGIDESREGMLTYYQPSMGRPTTLNGKSQMTPLWRHGTALETTPCTPCCRTLAVFSRTTASVQQQEFHTPNLQQEKERRTVWKQR